MRTQAEVETNARLSGMNERLMIYGARRILLNAEIEASEAAIESAINPAAALQRKVELDAAKAEMRSVVDHARQVGEAVAAERRQGAAQPLPVTRTGFTKPRAKIAAVAAGVLGLVVAAGCEAVRLVSPPCAKTTAQAK